MFSFIFGCIRIPISSTYHYVRDSSVLSVEVKKTATKTASGSFDNNIRVICE